MSPAYEIAIIDTLPLDILIVDDSPEDLAIVRRQLRTRPGKYEIRTAKSAAEALEECRLREPDCVLLDVRMPELDGLWFLQNATEAGANFPVIMMTSTAQDSFGTQAIQKGAQDFLIKGETTPEILRRAVDHACERFRMSRELARANAQLEALNAELNSKLQQLKAIFSQSTVGIAQADSSGRFQFGNEAFRALIGVSSQQLAALHLQDVTGGDELPSTSHVEGKRRYRRRDGSHVWVEASMSRIGSEDGIANGQSPAFLVVARDITKRTKAEAAQSLLASIVEATGDAAFYQDIDGIIRTWNRGAEKTYGYSAAEVIGKSVEILVPEDKLCELETLRERAALGNPPQDFETTCIRRDGYLLPVGVTFSAVRDPEGNVTGYVTTARDISERKRAEHSLRKSESRYRMLANAMPQIVYATNSTGEINFVNQRWSEYTGVAEQDASSYDWLDWVYPSDRAITMARWSNALANGTAFETEHRLRRGDGEYFWHLSRAMPLNDDENLVTGWNGTCTYIHDHKLVEENLRISEERLRLAQTGAGTVVWDLDLLADRYTEFPDFYAQFEFEKGEQINFEKWLRRIHPDDREQISGKALKSAGSGRAFETEFRVMRKDGSVRWLLGKGSTFTNGFGIPVRVTGINVDITERKRAEAELKESRERLHFALQAGRLAVWVWNVATDTVDCSEETVELLGGALESGQRSLDAFLARLEPVDRIETIAGLRTAVEQRLPYARDLRVRCADGLYRWIELQGAATPEASGQLVRVTGTARDITEKKLLEQRLASAEKYESIGVMAGGIAHDFNNLLCVIIGCADLARVLASPDSQLTTLLTSVTKAAERGAELTAQMLAYAGRGMVLSVPIDLTLAVEDALHSLQTRFSANSRTHLQLDKNVDSIGDPSQVQRAILNVITNAYESLTDGAGSVFVRVTRQVITQQYIRQVLKSSDLVPGTFAAVEVTDTGCGVDHSIKDKVFEPFFSTKFTGRGLGLAAAAGIVRAHKGAIHLTSEQGTGTSVLILLPLHSTIRNAPSRVLMEKKEF